MSFALVCCSLLVTACAALSPLSTRAAAAASAPPDSQRAAAILEGVAKTYRGFKSFHFQGTMRVAVLAQGQTQNIEMPFEVAMAKPGRSRMHVQNPMFRVLQLADGENTWMYIPQLSQYTRQRSAPLDPTGGGVAAGALTAATPLGRYLVLDQNLMRSTVLREENVDFEGKPRACWVIEAEFQRPGDSPVEASPTTFWIDKANNVVLREATVVKLGASPNGPMEMNQQTTFEVARFDVPLPDSLFTFTPPADAREVEQIAMPGMQAQESELIGKPAIPFALPNLAGKSTSLAAWKGKVVLLDFWASWCGPCRAEMPTIAKLDRELKSKGVVVVGINVGESKAVASGFLKKNGYTFPSLLDADGSLSTRYGASGIPTIVVIDRKGNVSSHFVGMREEAVLRDALRKAGVQ